ncbi:endolytic transglycosylase MltG [Paludibacterium sp. B53371]|nr:endolytic transglycosylase MltG [Paludibacterium sp. B53371]
MKWLTRLVLAAFLLAVVWLSWVVFVPIEPPATPYTITVGPSRTLSQVATSLKQEGVVRSRGVMVLLARLQGTDRRIKAGQYRFNGSISLWGILQRFAEGNPDEASATVVEGWTFRQFRNLLDQHPDVTHDTAGLSDGEILARIGASEPHPEGLFFPSTYYFTPGSSDLDIYRRAYVTMQRKLAEAWQGRNSTLPVSSPYQLLTLASLVEKETARPQDRTMIAAVFVNRLNKSMRLQTDPAVIYGMGDAYHGNITKADLRRDTPYNTYTRNGLTPTPIALPGSAALAAAAHPAASDVLYFVARGDGSSYFSQTLDQHNDAVRKYILKKGN